MEPDRWNRVWTLFHGALERPEGAGREAFLAEACAADSALRHELDSLLAAHLAESPPPGLADLDRTFRIAPEEESGSEIGPYHLVRRIGEGGMGIVWEAMQDEPVRRRVALKLIKLGMDTREVVRRFEAERQALALMDHSSIARVFDAGATPEGRPFFAMELVDGPSLTDFCDAWRLPIARRVALAATVCRAVHSAHQKGVIHRDLKASNVLVAAEEGGPVPKVIDFGIARAVQKPFEEGSLRTRLGELVGTPEAMSPEQAAMSSDLDTRTDIYSLGALLYELLTGARAFEFGQTPLPEMLRWIREVEPPPPSARFAATAPGAAERATSRGGTPEALRRELRGELDWVVAKAMAKERERRYGSAAELALDLERYLEQLPVSAVPPSRLYRVRKFAARHRIEAVAVAVLLAAGFAFTAMTVMQSRQLARALVNEERERATATQVSQFLVALLERPDPAVARGVEPTVKEALDWGVAKVETDLAGQPEIQARLLATIGNVQFNLGNYERAESALLRALELRRRLRGAEHAEVAESLQVLGELEFEMARYADSRTHGEAALAMRRRVLDPGDPAIADSLNLVAIVEHQAGNSTRAEALHSEALAIQIAAYGASHPKVAESFNLLGIVRRHFGDLPRAEEAYRKALSIWRDSLGPDHPSTAMAMNNLALTLHVQGDYRAALELFEALLPLRRKLLGDAHPDLMVTVNNYAKLLHDMGDLAGAERAYREAIAIAGRGLGEEHPQAATSYADLSAVVAKLGRPEESLELARRALAIREKSLGPEHTTVAASIGYLAQAHEANGDDVAAGALYERSVDMLRKLSPAQLRLADALVMQGLFRVRTGRLEEALADLEEAVAIFAALVPESDRRRARADSALGACLTRLGRYAEAEALLTRSLAQLSYFETPETAAARQRLEELRKARGRR